MVMKRYKVILNGQVIRDYDYLIFAEIVVSEYMQRDWFDNDADLVEIYDTETGEYIYTNENV